MPVGWGDLASGPERWTLRTVLPRLKRIKTDPWADYWTSRQRLSASSIKALRRL